jgi:hypothetical protein
VADGCNGLAGREEITDELDALRLDAMPRFERPELFNGLLLRFLAALA